MYYFIIINVFYNSKGVIIANGKRVIFNKNFQTIGVALSSKPFNTPKLDNCRDKNEWFPNKILCVSNKTLFDYFNGNRTFCCSAYVICTNKRISIFLTQNFRTTTFQFQWEWLTSTTQLIIFNI